MAAARNYRRQLLMLYQGDTGFGREPGKEPAGFLKLEVKGGTGLLTYLVQNLKDIKDEGLFYKGFIGVSNGPALVVTGTIPVDGRGRGENIWRFDPENVDGTGYGIDSFDVFGVMVCKPGEREQRIISPLVGRTGRLRKDWKEALGNSRESFAKTFGAVPDPEETRITDKTPEKDTTVAGDAIKGSRAADKPKTAKAPYTPEHRETGKASFIPGSMQKPEAPRRGTPERAAEQRKPEHGEHSGFEKLIEETLKFYPGIQPFEPPDPGCRWWRINSFDYLFGVTYDQNGSIEYYVYGIPGVYQTQAQMQMEVYGFYKWRPLKGEGHVPGEYGYWLAYVDAKTGILANPVKKGG